MNNIPTPNTIAATTRGIRKGLAEIALKQAVELGFDSAWSVGVCPICSGPMVRNFRKIGGAVKLVEECWLWLGSETRHQERNDSEMFPAITCHLCGKGGGVLTMEPGFGFSPVPVHDECVNRFWQTNPFEGI